jgi:ATP-dependent DNA helicase RecG
MPPMMPWLKAIQTIHFPFPCDQPSLISKQHPAFKRLIIDELFAHVYSLEKFRQTIKANAAPELIVEEDLLQRFLLSLPFTLTHAQTNAWQQIREDLNKKSPMLRLVQGDVGCGKTIVAALATLVAVSSKSQVAIMAPTEILAEQLFNQFTTWFSVLDLQAGYRCELLTSKLTAKQKRSVLENITLGLANIVVGTHALFQEAVKFHNLGLLVIDEQHRFGVHQRLALQNKGSHPHQLIMTATPIPRTLLMSHYAHVDVSVINMLPPGRQQIKTLVLSQQRRVEIIERISAICNQDQQVYWVCTLISESDTLTCQAAQTSYETLQTLLPNFRVGLVHGKMDHQAKENMMQEFYKGDIQILVATTVIEVGVNVPNATLMVIENPERLGLAQLHQLRGRVGRGSAPSFCILLYQGPLSETAQARLRILRETSDGFEIAKADLELRGPGEILGVKQTGLKAFKVADLKRDEALLELLVSEKNEQAEKIPSQVLQNISLRWKVSGEYGQV